MKPPAKPPAPSRRTRAGRPDQVAEPRLPAVVRGRRVLVVDDLPEIADTLALLLAVFGHEVQVATSGEEALRKASWFLPQFVLIDIGMPGMDGYQVAERLRQNRDLEHSVLIALTGWCKQDDRARALAAGFDHHLTKPADMAELQRILTRCS